MSIYVSMNIINIDINMHINICSGYSCSCGGDHCAHVHLFHLSPRHYWMELWRCVRTQSVHCDFDIFTDWHCLSLATRFHLKRHSHTKASRKEFCSIKSLLQLVLRVCELLNHWLWRSDPDRRSYCWWWVDNFYIYPTFVWQAVPKA